LLKNIYRYQYKNPFAKRSISSKKICGISQQKLSFLNLIMQTILIIIFFLCLILFIHSYILYPISIWILSIVKRKSYQTEDNFSPNVSIIISVFNEEKVIEKTIRNFLKSNYDLNKIEFVIGSDNSTDSTNEIVTKLRQEVPSIKFFPFPIRRGKSLVLNDLVNEASSEILIFSDANTIYHKDAIKNLVKYYVNQTVGGVSGKLLLLEFNESVLSGSQELKYWNFETWLKEKEGKIGKLIGANGGIYSLRKKYFVWIPTEHPVVDDFYLSLKVLEQKKDFLYIKDAEAEELTAPNLMAEFKRKIRGNANIFSTIKTIKRLLNPSFGVIAYSLWSHKLIRWFTPALLLLIFVLNIFLFTENEFFKYFLFVQILICILSLLGYILNKLNLRIQPLLLLFYFLMTNAAMLIGLLKYILGKNTAFWQSTPRR
jgi:cellulose synthase/poly-beta-1,6-N-acetylglucosamine synthase-like glycosyltransferase